MNPAEVTNKYFNADLPAAGWALSGNKTLTKARLQQTKCLHEECNDEVISSMRLPPFLHSLAMTITGNLFGAVVYNFYFYLVTVDIKLSLQTMDIKKALSESNRNKVLSGQQISLFITSQLQELKNQGIIENFEKNINFRHRSYSYDDQFLANYVIHTYDKKRVIVRSSNSFRSDRAKIGFYDLDGILRLSNLSDDIIATIYLVADQELNNPNFITLRERFIKKEFYCPASHLFTLSEFVNFLQNYHDETLSIFSQIKEEQKFDSIREAGSYYGVRGNQFEKEITNFINKKSFLMDYKSGKIDRGLGQILTKILEKHNLSKHDLTRVSATNSISLLKNGGNPKTDILLKIQDMSGDTLIETISVKKTKQKRVSCHDYRAVDFIRVLKCKGGKLEDYINLFEKYPSKKELVKRLPKNYSIDEFESLMSDKAVVLTQWALQGKHDSENIIEYDEQTSNFILIKYKSQIHFFEYDKYIKYILKNSLLVFSVPFSWTYPSKQRGKRIQLKMPIVLNLD